MRYKVSLLNAATGAVADTFTTMVALVSGSTVGHRGRLLSLAIGPADDTPADLNLSVKVNRSNQDTAGTPGATIAAADIPKADPSARDSILSAGTAYSIEPTTYAANAPWAIDLNRRGSLLKEWAPEEAIVWGPSETLGILLAPRTAAAATVTITVEWEEF